MKRVFDFLIGLFGFLILSPLFLIISIIALADDGMPVIFKQDRVGKDNKIFKIYKFRTMKKGVGDFATGKLKDADKKITGFGKFLRKTSLDELPQFFNLWGRDRLFRQRLKSESSEASTEYMTLCRA